jgi:hypothetical protein
MKALLALIVTIATPAKSPGHMVRAPFMRLSGNAIFWTSWPTGIAPALKQKRRTNK